MKKRNHFMIPTKYIFAVLAALCIVMMFLSYSTGLGGQTLGRMAGYIFVPFEQGLSSIGGWVREKQEDRKSTRLNSSHPY